jgi:hypothetical protein
MVSKTLLVDFWLAHWKPGVVLFIVLEGFSLCLIARSAAVTDGHSDVLLFR